MNDGRFGIYLTTEKRTQRERFAIWRYDVRYRLNQLIEALFSWPDATKQVPHRCYPGQPEYASSWTMIPDKNPIRYCETEYNEQ